MTYSLHRYTWPLSTWRRYKHALKCSTHAAKTFWTNRLWGVYFYEYIRDRYCRCTYFSQKEKHEIFFFYLSKRESSGQRLQLPSQEAVTSSCQPVNSNASLQSSGSKASNYTIQASFCSLLGFCAVIQLQFNCVHTGIWSYF